jgi:hypothetical protein
LEEDSRRKKEEEIKKGGHAAPLPRPATSAACDASASAQPSNTTSRPIVAEARAQERDTAVDKGRNEPVKEGRGKIKRKKKEKEKGKGKNEKKKNREIKEINYLFL